MKKINGTTTDKGRRDAMKKHLFIATIVIAMAFASTAMAKSPCQRTCENTYAPDPKCPDPSCPEFATTLRGVCIGDCKGSECGNGKCEKGENYNNCPSDCPRIDPCANEPGTKWCKLLKKCVPIADFDTVCKDAPSTDCPRGQMKDGDVCKPCFELGMMDVNGECVDPCSTDGVLIFSCMSWCPSLNEGHGGFIQAAQYAACEACPNGDNGMRCLAEGEGDCPDCNGGGGFDPTLLYVLIAMTGLGLILLVVLLAKKGKPTKCPKCGKLAVKNGVCRACWYEVDSKPAAPAPPAPRSTGSGPSAPTTAP